jgi:hypothetical protein
MRACVLVLALWAASLAPCRATTMGPNNVTLIDSGTQAPPVFTSCEHVRVAVTDSPDGL